MKQRIHFYLLGLLFLLLNNIAIKAYTPIKNTEGGADISYIISQEEATHNAIRFLYFIYSHTPREAVSIDNPSFYSKYIIKSASKQNRYRNSFQSAYLTNESLYAYFHPDPIGYYIYTLERIVI